MHWIVLYHSYMHTLSTKAVVSSSMGGSISANVNAPTSRAAGENILRCMAELRYKEDRVEESLWEVVLWETGGTATRRMVGGSGLLLLQLVSSSKRLMCKTDAVPEGMGLDLNSPSNALGLMRKAMGT